MVICINRCGVSFWGDKNVLELDSGDGYTIFVHILKITKSHTVEGWIFMLYELYLKNKKMVAGMCTEYPFRGSQMSKISWKAP